MSLFDQLKLLSDSQLHEDVKILSGMLLSLSEHNPEMISVATKYHVLVCQADSHFELQEYKKAESIYLRALQVRKMVTKTKGKTPTVEGPSEIDVKYKLHMCYRHQKQYREALNVLESLSAKQRNAKINLALAKMYQRTGLDRSAVTSYKEVLRECSLSVEAAQGLLSLGVKGAEVASLMMPGLGHINSEWLSSWVKAQAFSAGRDYTNAVSTLKVLDSKPLLRDNVQLLCQLGENQFLNGDYSQALITFQRAHSLDPLLTQHMDTLAYLLYSERKGRELGALANQLMSVTSNAPEPWVAMGYYCLITRKVFRAVYFATKAYMLDNRCIEALLMKGAALLELKKNQEAIPHFRETLRLMPHRFEPHKGLVECYLASRRTREAISCAAQAYKQLSTNARTLTEWAWGRCCKLYASVLAKEPLSLEKAKTYAEKAIKMDPSYLEPVYVMADILAQQRQYAKGVEFLKKQLQQHSTCRLHQMLAEFLEHTNDHIEALDHYNIALRMNPLSVAAYQGRDRVEKQSENGMDNTYDMEMEEMDESENDAELEGSDIESAWSDIDLN